MRRKTEQAQELLNNQVLDEIFADMEARLYERWCKADYPDNDIICERRALRSLRRAIHAKADHERNRTGS
jgi:hypothetical protein